MFGLIRPPDEVGIPRRFLSHSEAFLWVAGSLARMYGRRVIGGLASAVAAWLAWSLVKPVFTGFAFEPFPPGWIFAVVSVVACLLAT